MLWQLQENGCLVFNDQPKKPNLEEGIEFQEIQNMNSDDSNDESEDKSVEILQFQRELGEILFKKEV